MREQSVVLKDHTRVAQVCGSVQDGCAVKADVAAVGVVKAGYHPQQGGFAAAAGAQKGKKFAVADLQVYLVDHPQLAELFNNIH